MRQGEGQGGRGRGERGRRGDIRMRGQGKRSGRDRGGGSKEGGQSARGEGKGEGTGGEARRERGQGVMSATVVSSCRKLNRENFLYFHLRFSLSGLRICTAKDCDNLINDASAFSLFLPLYFCE